MKRVRSSGFTLIELVVVISILGILAIVVLPRLADLSDEAHRSSVDGTWGALAVASNLVHAQWITQGKPPDVDDLRGFGNEDVNLSDEGWAVGTSGTGNSSSMTIATCIEVWRALLIDQAPSVGTSLDVDFGVSIGDAATDCLFTYQRGGVETRSITYSAATGGVYRFNP